jgi:hypothetical protein
MKLTPDQITQNYYAGYQLALDIIQDKQESLGYSMTGFDPEIVDLAQSVFGCESLIQLIQTTLFDKETYTSVITKEIIPLAKSLFPDVGKRQYISLDKLHDDYSIDVAGDQDETPGWDLPSGGQNEISRLEVLDYIEHKLTKENYEYLKTLFDRPENAERDFIWNEHIFKMIDKSLPYLETKLTDIRRLYPDGIPFDQEQIQVKSSLTDEQIIGCYKNVCLGIYPRFPVNFFSFESFQRSAVITRYAVESVLTIPPLDVLRQKTIHELSAIGLRSIIRLFNYSITRVIRNAYPDLLMPWEEGHVDDGYWDDPGNRRLAIQWLIEEKLHIPKQDIPRILRDDQIKKSTFVEHGLSYLYNQYFKSVSKTIGFAYPELKPWELGSVPNSFWIGDEGKQRIIQAVQWMIRQLNIPISGIPDAVQNKIISRATFQQYGLSTVFERMFKKNMYHLMNTVYPNQFEMWEIGRVPTEYWDNVMNGYRASVWIARKEKIHEKKIASAIRSGKLSKLTFARYGLGGMLKKTFDSDIRSAFLPYLLTYQKDISSLLREAMLLSLLQLRIRQIKSQPFLGRLFKGLFFNPLSSNVERGQLRAYERIKKRIKQRMGDLSTRIMTEESE